MNEKIQIGKQELTNSRAKFEKLKNELNSKLSSYRDENRQLHLENATISNRIKELEATVLAQTSKLEETNANLFQLETQLEANLPLRTRATESQNQINQLTKQLVLWFIFFFFFLFLYKLDKKKLEKLKGDRNSTL